MDKRAVELELLDESNIDQVRNIRREDVGEDIVDSLDTIWSLTRYGLEHRCLGHTYAVRYRDNYVGVILLGEAIPWETDPEEMRGTPFYRLMGFVIDKRYRGSGLGSYVLEKVIDICYQEFGIRPIALGCHKDNHRAAKFYEHHGFRKTNTMEGNDRYYLRYPQKK